MSARTAARWALAAAVLVAAGVQAAGCERVARWLHPTGCRLCHRPFHRGMTVRIHTAGAAPERVCCLRCAITQAEQTGAKVAVEWVTDYPSGRRLAPDRAVYLVGSRLEPCAGPELEPGPGRRLLAERDWDRCTPSVIAFADPAAARRLQAKVGGRILTFDEVVRGTGVRLWRPSG